MTAAEGAASTYWQVLRRRGVGPLLLSAALSRLAGRMFLLIIVLFALGRFHSAVLAGWISFAAMAPGLVVSPLAGAMLDRLGAARAIAADMVATALILLLLVAADRAGVDSPSLVVLLVGLASLTSPLSSAGIRALIPRLVPPEALARANALDTSSFGLVDVVGPALGGALIGLLGPSPALLAVAALYFMAAVNLAPAIRAEQGRAGLQRRGLLAEAWAGLRFLLCHRALRGIAIAYSGYQASWGLLLVAVPVAIGPGRDQLVGWLWSACGVAGALGALAAGPLVGPGRERAAMVWGILVTAIGAALPSLPGLAVLVLGLMLVGVVAGPVDVGVLTLRQRLTPPEWLGRILAVSIGLNTVGFPVGAALGGVLAAHDPRWAFLAAGATSVASAICARGLLPAGRHDELT